MENNKFSYRYSAQRNKEVEAIRRKYIKSEESKLEALKRLDLRVKTAGTLEGLCFGIVGALLFGVGMCLFPDVLAALFMIIGMLLMLPAYPIYRRKAFKTRTELTPEILRLSEEIMRQ